MSDDDSSYKENDSKYKSDSWSSNKEKEIVSDFISTLLEEEKEEQEKNLVTDFIGSLFEEEKSKIIKKNENIIPLKKKVLNHQIISNKKQNNKNINNKNTIKRNYINIKNRDKDKDKERTIENEANSNSIIKKILNIKIKKNNLERNKSIEPKSKNNNSIFNDQNNSLKIRGSKNHSVKKRNIKKIKDNKFIEDRDKLYFEEESRQKYKAKIESEKEKKECEEKIKILKNHISAMKRQQDNMNKKLLFLKNKEDIINNAKKFKEKTKKDIYNHKIMKMTELEQRKKEIERQKEELNNGVKDSLAKSKIEKKNKYKLNLEEMNDINKIAEKDNNQKILQKIEKIKAIRENNKNISFNRRKILNQNYNDINEKKYESNMEKTKLLKEQIKKLITEEDECLIGLNRTKERLNIMTSSERYSTSGGKRKKNIHKPTTELFSLEKE